MTQQNNANPSFLAAYFITKQLEQLIEELCYAASPHPVQVYPTYNYFVPLFERLNETIDKSTMDKDARSDVVHEILGTATKSYLDAHKTIYENTDFTQTSEYIMVKWIYEVYQRLLAGESPESIKKSQQS